MIVHNLFQKFILILQSQISTSLMSETLIEIYNIFPSSLLIFQAKDPTDVMYGWCHKCREKYKEEYENLVG